MSNQKRNRDTGIPGHPTEFAPTAKDESTLSLAPAAMSDREALHMSESERLCELITESSAANGERRSYVRSLVELNFEHGVLTETDLEHRVEEANEWGADLSEIVGNSLERDDVANEYVEAIGTHLAKNPEDAPYMSGIAGMWLAEDEVERQATRGRALGGYFAPPSPESFEGAYEEGDPKLYSLRKWSEGN